MVYAAKVLYSTTHSVGLPNFLGCMTPRIGKRLPAAAFSVTWLPPSLNSLFPFVQRNVPRRSRLRLLPAFFAIILRPIDNPLLQ